MNRPKQVHGGGCIGGTHAKVDDGDTVRGGIGHGFIQPAHRHLVPVREHLHIVAEIDQQDVLTEFIERHSRITRQPVLDDFTFRFHSSSLLHSIRSLQPFLSLHLADQQGDVIFELLVSAEYLQRMADLSKQFLG